MKASAIRSSGTRYPPAPSFVVRRAARNFAFAGPARTSPGTKNPFGSLPKRTAIASDASFSIPPSVCQRPSAFARMALMNEYACTSASLIPTPSGSPLWSEAATALTVGAGAVSMGRESDRIAMRDSSAFSASAFAENSSAVAVSTDDSSSA